MANPVNVDELIETLLAAANQSKPAKIVEDEISFLCFKAKQIFLNETSLLELTAPIKILGDIYGDLNNLTKLFKLGGFPPETRYLCLGNYIDRGMKSIDTLCLLLAYKIKYQDKIFLLRGHHECAAINRLYGFYEECKRRFNIKIWKLFNDCLNCLPIAAVINEKIFCVHGGLSKELESMEQIRAIARPTEVPETGLLCDLLWSDPDATEEEWGLNDRGISVTFNANVIEKFLKKHGFDLICRSHQAVVMGYEYFENTKLVTINSFSNYGRYHSAIMVVDEALNTSFQLLYGEDNN